MSMKAYTPGMAPAKREPAHKTRTVVALRERVPQPEREAASGSTAMAPWGKRCTRCLCCPAVIVFEDEALCAACDDGTHPAFPEQHPAPPIEIPAPVLEPIDSQPANPQLKEEAPMAGTKSTRGLGVRLTEEQKQQIVAASPEISSCELARQLGCSSSGVDYTRKKAGIRSEAKRGSKPQPSAPAPAVEHATKKLATAMAAQSKRVTEDLVLLRHEVRELATTYSSNRIGVAKDRVYLCYRNVQALAEELFEMWEKSCDLQHERYKSARVETVRKALDDGQLKLIGGR